ncbi:hypothetical protein MRB53_041906 [Persea americana]|nr:hypothetical protein MRB53_041906 [Persea americana]
MFASKACTCSPTATNNASRLLQYNPGRASQQKSGHMTRLHLAVSCTRQASEQTQLRLIAWPIDDPLALA